MNPFENEGEDYKGLEDSNFHLSRDMSLSNLLEHDRDNQSRFSTSKIKPEEANISSIKQKIIDRDELLRELNKLRSANEDLTTENEKYKDEVVELRERLVQSTSAGNINKLHEQINHLKSLNEQLTQRVHNLEKELGGKEGNESDKKALKTLRKELETKEEELAANRQLLESSYVTVQKYKEKLQKVNVATKSGRTMSQNLSTVKIQHCNITAVEAMSIREVVAGDSAWHVKVIGLQEEVINLKNRVYELDVINYKQQLELLKYKTGQLKPKSEGDLIEEDLSLYKGVGDVEDVIQKRVEELFNSKGKSLVQDFVEKQLGKKGTEDDNKLRIGEQESLDWLNFMEKEEEIKEEKKEVKKGKDARKEKEKKEDKQKKEKEREKERKDVAKKESKTRDRDSSGEEVVKKKVKMDAPSKENIAKNITKENNVEQQAQFNVGEIGNKKEKEVVVPMVVEKDVKASPQQQKKPVLKSNDPRRKISQSKDALVQPPPPVIQQQVNPEKELEEMFRTDSKDSKDSNDEGKQEQKVQSQALHSESSEQRIDTGKAGKEKIEEEFLALDDWDKKEDNGEREKMNVEEEKLHQIERDKINEEDKTEAKDLEEKNRENPMQVEDITTPIPVKDQTMTNLDQNLIVEEPQAMITEPGEIEAKSEKVPEEVKEVVKAKETEKVNLQDVDRQIEEAIKEGRFSSRTELVENSFETIMSLYLHKFEAAKYFDANDNSSFNKRRKLLEVFMGAINIEGLSEIAMKIIETFVKLSKKHQFSCLAFSFWAFLKDVTTLSSRSYTTSLNRLAGSLYNYLLLPYISKKQHEGQHTHLHDFTSLEKWRYLAFISNVLEVPLDGLDADLAFGALLDFKDYDDIVSRHMEALTKLNVFTNNPLQVLLLVGILSIYKTCQKALPVLDILIDLVCYQTENQISHCNLIFVTINSAWRFIRENLGLLSPHNTVDEGFLIEGSSFAYLFAFKFLPLPEEHPYVYNLDLIFVVLRLAVLRIFSKLPENDAAQSIKLKLMINKLREQPADTLRDMYEEGFNQWLSDNLRMEKLNGQVWKTEQTVSLYKDNHTPALNVFYEFAKECLNRGLKAENPLTLPQDTDPKEIQVENGVNVIDIVISLQVAGSIFTQTEWCDQLIEGTLFKYIQGDEYKDSLQRILTIAGLGLFLASIQSEECTERVNELLVNVVTGREGDYSMLDRLMAFVVLGTYNSDLLRENLGEVRIDDRLVEYLEGDILDIYMSA